MAIGETVGHPQPVGAGLVTRNCANSTSSSRLVGQGTCDVTDALGEVARDCPNHDSRLGQKGEIRGVAGSQRGCTGPVDLSVRRR